MPQKEAFLANLVGQTRAKKTLEHFYNTYRKTGIFRNCLFIGEKGIGKTTLIREMAKLLEKQYIEVPSASISNKTELISGVLIPYTQEEPNTIFFDECHALSAEAINFLLSVLQPNREYKNSITLNKNETLEVDFHKTTFFFATTEPQKLPLTFKRRLYNLTLTNYSKDELLDIIFMELNGTRIGNNVSDFLVDYLGGTASEAADLGREIDCFCNLNGISNFTLDNAKELVDTLNMYEFGLASLHLEILKKLLYSKNGLTLTRLAAKMGLTRAAQMDVERDLIRHDLMEIDGKRFINLAGLEYLKKNLI